jgi:hypothetical protein
MKVLNISNHQGNAHQTVYETPPHTLTVTILKKPKGEE